VFSGSVKETKLDPILTTYTLIEYDIFPWLWPWLYALYQRLAWMSQKRTLPISV
jgi:hypothetical protein